MILAKTILLYYLTYLLTPDMTDDFLHSQKSSSNSATTEQHLDENDVNDSSAIAVARSDDEVELSLESAPSHRSLNGASKDESTRHIPTTAVKRWDPHSCSEIFER